MQTGADRIGCVARLRVTATTCSVHHTAWEQQRLWLLQNEPETLLLAEKVVEAKACRFAQQADPFDDCKLATRFDKHKAMLKVCCRCIKGLLPTDSTFALRTHAWDCSQVPYV